MDYEKTYKEALERAREIHRNEDEKRRDMEWLLPELKVKESKDEKIRKRLIEWVKEFRNLNPTNADHNAECSEAIAWLEKQGERNTTAPQWMIDFLNDYRRRIGCVLDYDESREVDGKILAILEWLEKQGSPKMSAEALREGVAHYGITQYQIDNWLKKYVEIESTEPKSTVCPKYEIGDVLRVKNSNHEFIISRITDGYYHSKGAFIEIRIADDVNGDWEYARHIQPEPKFNIGDTILAKPETCMEHIPFHITSIEGGFYWDGDDSILIDNQDDFVLVGKTVKEPAHKFNVGDWIVRDSDGLTMSIKSVKDEIYYFHQGGNLFVKDVDECFHPWTIQDAKDGDVLTYNNGITEITLLFDKWINGVGSGAYSHVQIYDNEILFNNWSDCGEAAHPATKEQRDLLFQKMQEAGYEWDAEKLELKKIEQKPAEWSEEDVEILKGIEQCVYDNVVNIGTVQKVRYIDWLKSIKDRILPQPKQEWSEEQLEAVKRASNGPREVNVKAILDERFALLMAERDRLLNEQGK